MNNPYEHQHNTDTITYPSKPDMYKVYLLNDDYTPMEFVISVLQNIFGKTYSQAEDIMLNVHNNGMAVCGVYTYEIAETKVAKVVDYATSHEHPLRCGMEKE